MASLLTRIVLCLSLFFTALAQAQSTSGSGYTGYSLQLEGDDDSVLFETANTQLGTDGPAPDVFLNASGKLEGYC